MDAAGRILGPVAEVLRQHGGTGDVEPPRGVVDRAADRHFGRGPAATAVEEHAARVRRGRRCRPQQRHGHSRHGERRADTTAHGTQRHHTSPLLSEMRLPEGDTDTPAEGFGTAPAVAM